MPQRQAGRAEPSKEGVGLGREFSSDPHPQAHWRTALSILAATGLSGVTYDGVRRTAEVVNEVQEEVRETVHFLGQVCRVTVLAMWVGLCIYFCWKNRGYFDLYLNFLKTGWNLEGNVTVSNARNRLQRLSEGEARDVRTVLARLKQWRPRALDDPTPAPLEVRAASLPPKNSQVKLLQALEGPRTPPGPPPVPAQPIPAPVELKLFTEARQYKDDLLEAIARTRSGD